MFPKYLMRNLQNLSTLLIKSIEFSKNIEELA